VNKWLSMGLTVGFLLYIVTYELGIGWPLIFCMIGVAPPFVAGFLAERPRDRDGT
jgi:hypothetical protein